MERRRREMMSDARQRDEERSSRVAQHRAEVAREEQEASVVAQHEEATLRGETRPRERAFVQNMMLSHAASSSVEDQVRRQAHRVQRSHTSMNSNAYRK